MIGTGLSLAIYVGSNAGYQFTRQDQLSKDWNSSHPTAATASPGKFLTLQRPRLALGKALAKITVPSIAWSGIVLEGTDGKVLSGGPGHLVGTAYPGESDNVVISNHNSYSQQWSGGQGRPGHPSRHRLRQLRVRGHGLPGGRRQRPQPNGVHRAAHDDLHHLLAAVPRHLCAPALRGHRGAAGLMARVLRGVFLAGLAITLAAMSVGAAGFGQPPTVSGLSSYVVSPGQVLTVAGNHFSSDLSPGDCGLSGAPTVVFNAIDGSGAHAVKPSSTGAAVCTNTMVKVQVPAFGTGATVYVVDSANQPSNTSSSGFYPQVTVQPSGGVSPTSGPVGTQVTVNGANLKPPTVASTPNFNLTIGGQARAATWGGSISFSPGTTSGDTQVSFAVSGDANNAASPTQAVTVDAGAFTFLSPSLQTSAISGQVVGNRVTLSGANLGSGGTVSFSGGVPGQGCRGARARSG